jgi:hypothetical protein
MTRKFTDKGLGFLLDVGLMNSVEHALQTPHEYFFSLTSI